MANDLFSPYDTVYDDQLPQREQDTEQAKALLKQAGHAGLTVELVTAPIAQGTVSSAELLAQQAQASGINITLRQVTSSDLFGPNWTKWTFTQDYWDYYQYFAPGGVIHHPDRHLLGDPL